jgi:hypothetical protein
MRMEGDSTRPDRGRVDACPPDLLGKISRAELATIDDVK